jgi:hypothetical protein
MMVESVREAVLENSGRGGEDPNVVVELGIRRVSITSLVCAVSDASCSQVT